MIKTNLDDARSPKTSGLRPVRVADLYCGEGAATRAATSSGMEVVYAYDPVSFTGTATRRTPASAVDGMLGPVKHDKRARV